MDGICAIGLQEQASLCCVCKFPLLQFCEEHLREHRAKPGFHFTLPLEAKDIITTMELSIQYYNWLYDMSLSFDLLREKVEQLSLSENEIDAVYSALQQHAYNTAVRLKHEFSVAKTQFREVVESAIKETSDKILETQSFVPENYLSRLLWSGDSIDAQQFYSVQVNYVKENLDSAFQVALRFTVPGLEHLTVGQSLQSPNERIGELMRALNIKDETHTHELEGLRKALEDAKVYSAESAKTQQRQESAIQDLQCQLQEAQTQLQELHNDVAAKESHFSALVKENSNLVTQLKEKEEQLNAANDKIAGLKERCSALAKQVKELDEASRVRLSQAPIPAAPLEKLIAVLENQVHCFDVATSQWQQLLTLHRKIKVDKWTSSTFIPPNRIYVCGGGGGGGGLWDRVFTKPGGSSAYLLEGDGSVEELPHMSTERLAPGLAWDSDRQALYVFGGYGGRGTCYTDYLRTSEMLLSVWSPLPDIHQARSEFNPCWHSSLVYLCGGYTNSVETYEPRSNTYALQNFTLQESSPTTAVVESGVITVISKGYISKLQQGRITSRQHGQCLPWSNCTSLVSGGVAYVVDLFNNCCHCIDLTTGAEQKKVSLS